MTNATAISPKKPRFVVYKKIESVIEYILKICAYSATALLIVMMFITTYHVIGRYVFGAPVPGLTELSGFMMTISIFFLIAYVMVKDGHVAVGFLSDHLKIVPRLIMDSFLFILGLIFSFLASWITFKEALVIMSNNQISVLLHVPMYIFSMFVSIGWGLLGISIIIFVINMILKAVENE
jgi:TRAP-type C4-dicarboxylate transport system permease small subunit